MVNQKEVSFVLTMKGLSLTLLKINVPSVLLLNQEYICLSNIETRVAQLKFAHINVLDYCFPHQLFMFCLLIFWLNLDF